MQIVFDLHSSNYYAYLKGMQTKSQSAHAWLYGVFYIDSHFSFLLAIRISHISILHFLLPKLPCILIWILISCSLLFPIYLTRRYFRLVVREQFQNLHIEGPKGSNLLWEDVGYRTCVEARFALVFTWVICLFGVVRK